MTKLARASLVVKRLNCLGTSSIITGSVTDMSFSSDNVKNKTEKLKFSKACMGENGTERTKQQVPMITAVITSLVGM